MVDFSCLNTHLCDKIHLRHDHKVRNEVRKKSLPEPASGGWISVAQIDRLRPIKVDWLRVSEAHFFYWLWAKNRSSPAKPIIKAYYLASGIPLLSQLYSWLLFTTLILVDPSIPRILCDSAARWIEEILTLKLLETFQVEDCCAWFFLKWRLKHPESSWWSNTRSEKAIIINNRMSQSRHYCYMIKD